MELSPAEPKMEQKVLDPAKLENERQMFEDRVRSVDCWETWEEYAAWEEQQGDLDRARSAFERGLQAECYYDLSLWMKYGEMEMRNSFVNRARDLWKRAVNYLPRVDQLWLNYAHTEEVQGNLAEARNVFETFMLWDIEDHAWLAYIQFEVRCQDLKRARKLYERSLGQSPNIKTWLRYAEFESTHGAVVKARDCYQRALEMFAPTEELLLAFADFETRCNEYERARAVYKCALDKFPKEQEVRIKFERFRRLEANREGSEDLAKKRLQYEDELKSFPFNYDTWLNYALLEQRANDSDKLKKVLERAIAKVPPSAEKSSWKWYIHIWLLYAEQDRKRGREVYKQCVQLLLAKKISSGKVWLMAAKHELKNKKLASARKVMDMAIESDPKPKIFDGYIQMEQEIVLCRNIYEKYLEWSPGRCRTWIEYAEYERRLYKEDRARDIYERAVSQPVLDTPELVWKAYLAFEVSEHQDELAERLSERFQRAKLDFQRHQRSDRPSIVQTSDQPSIVQRHQTSGQPSIAQRHQRSDQPRIVQRHQRSDRLRLVINVHQTSDLPSIVQRHDRPSMTPSIVQEALLISRN